MNRRYFLKSISIGAAGLTFGASPISAFAKNEGITITILHTNDMHCHIEPFAANSGNFANEGGLARISALVKQIRAENKNTLLFDAGDLFQGTPYYNYFKGGFMLKLMSKIGYDAGTIGNHEFDDGLEGILNALPEAKFPLINSNYDFSETILAGKFKRYKTFKNSGIKIGLYGLGIELRGLVAEKNYGKTVYNDPVQTALEMEAFLKYEKHCDLVICLSHLGLRYRDNKVSDLVLAAETSLTDLIIGGHTHSYLEKPMELKNKVGNPVIVNQASWGGLVLGRIDFHYAEAGKNSNNTTSQNIRVVHEA